MTCGDIHQMGDCGFSCPIFLDGECTIPTEMLSDKLTGDQLDLLFDLYEIEDETEWF
jgi:hypothetical protein